MFRAVPFSFSCSHCSAAAFSFAFFCSALRWLFVLGICDLIECGFLCHGDCVLLSVGKKGVRGHHLSKIQAHAFEFGVGWVWQQSVFTAVFLPCFPQMMSTLRAMTPWKPRRGWGKAVDLLMIVVTAVSLQAAIAAQDAVAGAERRGTIPHTRK